MPVPAKPSITSISDITANSLFVHTKQNTEIAQSPGYQVRASPNSNMSSAISVYVAPTGGTISGLTHTKQYYIQARAQNTTGWSDWSDTVLATTKATVPNAPQPYHIEAPDPVTIRYYFTPAVDDGGAGVIQYQVGWGTDPNAPTYFQDSDENGNVTINGVGRNTLVYVWSRSRNVIGWSEYSSRSQVQTPAYTPASPSPIAVDTVTQVSVHYTFALGDNGGANVLESQVGYGTDPNNIQYTVDNSGDIVVGGLSPATVWYFWARARNQSGWSNWSQRLQARTVAGARINVSGSPREAIPYVKDGGVWKLAQPYVKSVGLWKKSV